MAAILTLLLGAAMAVLRVSGPALGILQEVDEDWLIDATDWLDDLRSSTLVTAVLELVLGAALIAAVAGLYYWAPKMFGRRLNPAVGALAGLALLGGAVLSGGTNVVTGMLHEGDRVYHAGSYLDVTEVDAVEVLNIVGFIGVALMAAGILLVVLDLVVAVGLGKGDAEGADDPWDGHTLEWATDSPPPVGNFPAPPDVVVSERPLLDAKEGDA